MPVFSADNSVSVVVERWPPYVDPDNPTGGLCLELIRASFHTQGYQIIMIYLPWARGLRNVKEGVYDILPDVWYSDERSEYFLFSNPYLSNKVKFISNREDAFNYRGIDSLTGKTVGTIRDFAYSQEFTDSVHFKKDPANHLMGNILKLINNRVDLVIEDEIVAKTVIGSDRPELLDQLYFSDTSFLEKDLYIATGYNNPRHKEIIEKFNIGLDIIKSNGTYDKIIEKYLNIKK